MHHPQPWHRKVLIVFAGAVLAIFLPGCANSPTSSPAENPNPRVLFTNVTINKSPANLALDTNAELSALFGSGASRLNVNFSEIPNGGAMLMLWVSKGTGIGISQPVGVTMEGQTFRVPFGVVSHYNSPEDGFIGWPQVQDNILVFDSVSRTVRAVAQLPQETANWLKLKISRDHYSVLKLETPLPGGKTGWILVDTDAPFGVALPTAHWKAWQKAHPSAPASTIASRLPLLSTWAYSTDVWADEVQLGALTLTDLPVCEKKIRELSDEDQEIGVLGLYALSRLDLVVDGKNGFAYLHPKPPPGPPYPGFYRTDALNDQIGNKDWVVAPNVAINVTRFFLASAQYKESLKDYDGAIADDTRAINLDPKDPDAWVARAWWKVKNDDYNGAIADYTQALTLNHGMADVYLNRGLLRQFQGDFPGAIDDFDEAIKFYANNSTSSAVEAVHYAILLRQLVFVRISSSSTDFSATISTWKDSWTKTLGQFIAGEITLSSMLTASEKVDVESASVQDCEACYYAGMMCLIKGDLSGASHYFEAALDTQEQNQLEYQLARIELSRLAPVDYDGFYLRGFTRQIHGDLTGALDDYQKAIAIFPGNSDNPRLYAQVIDLQLAHAQSSDFLSHVAAWDDGWTKTIGQFLASELDESAFLAAAEKPGDGSVPSRL